MRRGSSIASEAVWRRVERYRAAHPRCNWREVYGAVVTPYRTHRALCTAYKAWQQVRISPPEVVGRTIMTGADVDVCAGCQRWGRTTRFQGRSLCAACLNPADPPLDAVTWSAQQARTSMLGRAADQVTNEGVSTLGASMRRAWRKRGVRAISWYTCRKKETA